MDYERTIQVPATKAGQVPLVPSAVRALVSEPFVAALAAAIPVDLIAAETTQPSPVVWHQVMRCAFTTTGLDVPPVARKILPDVVRLSWEQTWTLQSEAAATATLRVVTDSSPSATTTGDVRLTGAGDALAYAFTGRTKVSVPFIGGSLDDLIDDHLIGDLLNDQLDVLAAQLRAPS